MSTIRQVLARKGGQIHRVGANDRVLDAIRKMAELDVGSVVVMDGDRLAGIFTERHYSRDVFLKGRSSPETPVGEVMERNVVCIDPDKTVEEGMAIMNAKRVGHLPVIAQEKLLGIVSIGDLVKSLIDEKEFVIEQLEHYIHG